jgi:hypothetical protein
VSAALHRGPSSTARAAVVLLALAPPLAVRAMHAPGVLRALGAALAAWLLLEWIGTRLRGAPMGDMRADLAGVAVPAVLLLCIGDIGWPWLAGALVLASLMRHGLGGAGLAPFHPGLAAAVFLLATGVVAPAPQLAAMPAACTLGLVVVAWRGGGTVIAPLALLGAAAAVIAPLEGLAPLAAGSLPVIVAFVASDPARAGHRIRTQAIVGAIAGLLGGMAWLGGVAEPWPAALLASQAALPWLEARDARRRARALQAP